MEQYCQAQDQAGVAGYLGPDFAVLLFARVAPLGVAWLRTATAAVVFAVAGALGISISGMVGSGAAARAITLGVLNHFMCPRAQRTKKE
jgi:threonine/homoserine efflux transporter RhtA